MLKKILVALISAQLIIVPAQAETKKPVHCTKAIIGFDDALLFIVSSWLIWKGWQSYKIVSKRIEDEKKAKQTTPEQIAPDCKL